jgi:hemolysin D
MDAGTRSGANTSSGSQQRPGDNTNAGYVYKVFIHTDQSALHIGGDSRAVQSGMTVQADITTDRRRLIEFFLSPVVKYMDEGLKVR